MWSGHRRARREAEKAKEPERIELLVKPIEPGLNDLDVQSAHPAMLDTAVEANVRRSLRQLTDIPAGKWAVKRHRCTFVGGTYDLQTGKVRLLA